MVADTLTADLTLYENGTQLGSWDAVSTFRGVSEGTVTRFALEKREPLKNEHEAFQNAILGRSKTHVSLAEGLEVLRVDEAAIESGKTGTTVSLQDKL